MPLVCRPFRDCGARNHTCPTAEAVGYFQLSLTGQRVLRCQLVCRKTGETPVFHTLEALSRKAELQLPAGLGGLFGDDLQPLADGLFRLGEIQPQAFAAVGPVPFRTVRVEAEEEVFAGDDENLPSFESLV